MAAQTSEFRFHHLHLTDGFDFYARLFVPSKTRTTTINGFQTVESGPMRLLFGRPPSSRSEPERESAIWQFGWGDVSLGDTYLRHAGREVEWEPPMPADKFHLHLVSRSPGLAAAWYRDTFGAVIDVLPGTLAGRAAATRPELRSAEAIVRLGEFAMVIYRTDGAIYSTRGQRADHAAFAIADLSETLRTLRTRGVTILEPIAKFDTTRAAMIEGPDRIAIELVEATLTKH